MDKTRKKNIQRIISLVCIAAIVVLLAAMPLIAKQDPETDGPQASILSGTVGTGSIDTELIGGGTLTEDDAVTISVPAEVKLTEFLVSNGQMVTEGTPIASVDRVTVMTAIQQVQETLEYLSEEIADADDYRSTENVTALAGGTVKVIYAEEGESVQSVMLDHGALAVLSLDDLMAVDLETESTLAVGTAVTVTLSDGTEALGKIAKNLTGEMTVTVADAGYTVGDAVKISSEDGTSIGSGELYIYSPWNATAYAGTVSSIYVSVGSKLSAGKALMTLSDVGYSATYRQLISQRQEYEDLMMDLFEMYQTETITAPCDGIVSGVDEDGAHLLSGSGESWTVKLLSFFGEKAYDGYIAYAAKVAEVTESGMNLLVAPQRMDISDLTKLSSAPADISAMTEIWNYSGDTTVYTQSENGLLQKAENAKAGDILLIVGDEEKVQWFVALDGSTIALQQTAAENENRNGFLALLSENENGDNGNEQTGGGDQTGGDQTGGDQTGGDQTGGDQTGGDQTGGDQTGGDQTGGDQTGGDQTGGDQTGGEQGDGSENENNETYLGYVAQVIAIENGIMKVKQTAYSYTITDPSKLPTVTVDVKALTQDASYDISALAGSAPAANDYLLLIVEQDGKTLKGYEKLSSPATDDDDGNDAPSTPTQPTNPSQPSTPTQPGSSGNSGASAPSFSGGGMPSGGGWGGGSGMMQQESSFELYGLEMTQIAAVTPQDTMTMDITVDELDVTALYVGMSAQVKIDALGGEKHTAVITEIGNTGTNNGGNSKYTVELTMDRAGEMLSGMNATATIVLATENDVLTIPADALVENGNQTVVYTGYDEENDILLNPVTVKVGCSDGETVEILEGLAAGQTYYYAYYDTLEISFTPDFGGGGFMFG